jgi:protein gp37
MENTSIEWAHHTANIWWGCYEVHPGCDNCYAKKLANRYHGPDMLWQQSGPRMLIKSVWKDLARYQKKAEQAGERHFVFINSMSDIFEKEMPVVNFDHTPTNITTADLREKLFELIPTMPNLIFLLLTKRPSNIMKMVPPSWIWQPPKNMMYGISVVDQQTYDTLMPQFISIEGRKFLSMEPLLADINLAPVKWREPFPGTRNYANQNDWLEEIDWVIVGGESGHNARPMDPNWVRNIKERCDKRTDMARPWPLPFFFKQWGEWYPDEQIGGTAGYLKNGKKLSGSLLDGKEYKEFPSFPML